MRDSQTAVLIHRYFGEWVNRLYAEAAATGSRNTLREALEIDPALTGIDLLYAEGVVADMLENQKEKYPRFFRE